MAKRKRQLDEADILLLQERAAQIRREDLELKQEIEDMDDEQRRAVEAMFEQCKQRSPVYVEVLSKRPESDSFRRHFEEVLLAEAVKLVKHPPKPTGEELIRCFIRDMLAEMRVGATLEELKAWARVKYPDVGRHWK